MKDTGVIVKLRGGLGNQMFQYATGLAVAKRSGRNLLLDTSGYVAQPKKDTPRSFGLSEFALTQETQTVMNESPALKFIRKVHAKLFPQDPYAFDPKVFNKKVLDGFYQNERYFKSIRETLLTEFSLKDVSEKFNETEKFIRSKPSVAIHVRRGDYVTSPHANAHHGALELEYFRKAYGQMVSRIGSDFVLFIFTDDVEWTKENLTLHADSYVISGQGFTAAQELLLMSACSHQIISNSTFSWWAAWLNRNESKIVIAPRQWMRTSAECAIIPSLWTKI